MPEVQVFVKSMTVDEFKNWSDYARKQKNMDRIVEYTKDTMKQTKEYEAILDEEIRKQYNP